MSKLTRLVPRPSMPEEWARLLKIVAAQRDITVTDLIREAIESHPDIARAAKEQNLPPIEISRGGYRERKEEPA